MYLSEVIDWNTNHMHKQDGTGKLNRLAFNRPSLNFICDFAALYLYLCISGGFPNWGIAVIGIVAVIGTIFASVWYCSRKSGNRWILQNCV